MYHLQEDPKEEDYSVIGILPSNKSVENSQNNYTKYEEEHIILLQGVRTIIESYWSHFNVKISDDVVFTVAKLVTNYIDKLMKCAAKLSNSRNCDTPFTMDSILSVLENDDRKLKRAQDVIRINRRKHELLSAFDDTDYIKCTHIDNSKM
ncbi:hypothetical protein FG386_002916 [Cryptosporidium ryanae]|uniref:uncharacterized protein n=1 Tax=Cryptosporidium ryanae TaxID=515981 RepID=UPI00351A952B|nr:hypothetical protein FG386_002916 [Cryptosporidium ryanae]